MKIREAIERIDSLLHNVYSRDEKLAWLSGLDLEVKQQILDAHEGAKTGYFGGYHPNTPDTMALLVSAPYDQMYLRWLEAQIHYHNGEYDKYNNAMAMFQSVYDAFANHYRRTHLPKTAVIRYF